MSTEKNTEEKTRLHIRNKNREKYDLDALIIAVPELEAHIKPNKYEENSVDFSNPDAVKLLNQALLKHCYGIENWDFPAENLVPPIPGRADYLHYIADLLTESNYGKTPTGEKIIGLDIGTGASCIYPIIGSTEYNWSFIATDINEDSVKSAEKIVSANPTLEGKITVKTQGDSSKFFEGIIENDEKIDFTICNPPFHSSTEEAEKGSRRKVKNLSGKKHLRPPLNFAGISDELIYEGGEHTFIHNMLRESKEFAQNCYWFSTLVSKKSNLKGIYRTLNELEVFNIKTIPTGTGNKASRIIAWTFLNKEEQKDWKDTRWKME